MAVPVGLALAIILGAALAVFGAGGSIVTVPILLYAFGLDVHRAAATSLFIVGLVAVAGLALRWRTVCLRAGLVFGAAGMVGAPLGAWLHHQVPPPVVLGAFGVMMLAAATRLLRSSALPPRTRSQHPAAVVLGGAAVGVATGFLGVGGGFIVVPALMLLLGLDLVHASATSLLVIALNSAAALAGHGRFGPIEWQIGLGFAAMAVVGAVVAIPLARRVRPHRLQRAFAAILLGLGLWMLGGGAW